LLYIKNFTISIFHKVVYWPSSDEVENVYNTLSQIYLHFTQQIVSESP